MEAQLTGMEALRHGNCIAVMEQATTEHAGEARRHARAAHHLLCIRDVAGPTNPLPGRLRDGCAVGVGARASARWGFSASYSHDDEVRISTMRLTSRRRVSCQP